jgi:ech hydrogenase subunit D
MYLENQPLLNIERKDLPAKAAELKKDGYRLVQACCLDTGTVLEVTYSFDKGGSLLNVRVSAPKSDPKVPSITGAYLAALTYENELQDLFGLKVEGLALDFGGKFYRSAGKSPFAKTAPQGGQ